VTNSRSAHKEKRVAIVGQGYVGLPLAMAAAGAGWQVLGIEKFSKRVVDLNSGYSPVEDVLAQIRINSSDGQEEFAAMSQTFG
jgi:UDP-N-acetyl-D-mannosaminuronate dehydrogenase